MDKLVFNENNIPVFQFVPYRVLHIENGPVTEIAAEEVVVFEDFSVPAIFHSITFYVQPPSRIIHKVYATLERTQHVMTAIALDALVEYSITATTAFQSFHNVHYTRHVNLSIQSPGQSIGNWLNDVQHDSEHSFSSFSTLPAHNPTIFVSGPATPQACPEDHNNGRANVL
jgi:hypothetical protein